MAEEYKDQAANLQEEGVGDVKDRGLFDHFKGKKEEAAPEEQQQQHQEDQQEVLVTGVGKIHIYEGHREEEKKEKEEEKHGILDKLHRSHSSSSSSSSDEEVLVEGEGGIKEKIKKKKKALKDKVDQKFHGGEKKEEEEEPPVVPPAAEDTSVDVEKVDAHESPAASEEEKKGFLDKIKEKLPGHGKKPAEECGFVSSVPFPAAPEAAPATEGAAVEHGKEQEVEGHEGKEKKGFLGKIMEKLPGYHKNTGEEGEKSPVSH